MRIWLSYLVFCAALLFLPPEAAIADEVISAPGIGIRVNPGAPDETTAYYQRISANLGLADTRQDLPDLNAFLAHFGYSSLSAEKLEILSPAELMAAFPNDKLLAARFFAPKIVDFNIKGPDAQYPYKAGWRKLIRIEPISGSKADAAGLKSAYILFNYVQALASDAPFPEGSFKTESVNTQVIVTPRSFSPNREDSAFFLDFDTRSGGYKIHDFLSAAFDVAQDPKHPDETKRNYYVPTACAQCHGHDQEGGYASNGAFPYAKLNYLDTDQWYDMMTFGEFPSTLGSYDVLFDGGLDHSSQSYKAAFGVVQKLNIFIRDQNVGSIHPNDLDLFKVKAVEKWETLHATDLDPASPVARALDLGNGSAVWQDNSDDRALLGLLDQYCFRCHSSVLYNVFDKQAIVDRAKTIVRYVTLPTQNASHMPQGRELEAKTITDIVSYVKSLK